MVLCPIQNIFLQKRLQQCTINVISAVSTCKTCVPSVMLHLEQHSNTSVHRSQTYCHNPLLKPPLCHFKIVFSSFEPCDVGSQQGLFLNNGWIGVKSQTSAGREDDQGALCATLQPVWTHACAIIFRLHCWMEILSLKGRKFLPLNIRRHL